MPRHRRQRAPAKTREQEQAGSEMNQNAPPGAGQEDEMSFKGGPYIQTACFCETVIEDKTGVLSLIRIIDTVTRTVAAPDAPDDMPPFPHTFQLVVMLKSGEARGRYNLRIVPQLPTGATENAILLTVHLEGEEKGMNFNGTLNFTFTMEGLYWFNVFLDDEQLTAIPLRVKYNRVVIGATQAT